MVDRHGLDQRLEVLGLDRQPIRALLEQLVEQDLELLRGVLPACIEALLDVLRLEDPDLGVEAVEERDVARLVGDLRAEEDPHLLVGRGAHDRPELGGDALLADEERAEPAQALEALLIVEALVPVDAVLREVEVLRGPLLALPQLVELAVAEQLEAALLGGGADGGVAGGLEVGAVVQ